MANQPNERADRAIRKLVVALGAETAQAFLLEHIAADILQPIESAGGGAVDGSLPA